MRRILTIVVAQLSRFMSITVETMEVQLCISCLGYEVDIVKSLLLSSVLQQASRSGRVVRVLALPSGGSQFEPRS